MLRPENAVAGDIHHAVAHRRSRKHTHGGYEDHRAEARRLRANCRRKKIDSIIAHTHRQVKHRQDEEEDDNT